MKKLILIALFLFIPIEALAICSPEGYTMIYVNGIFTTRPQAELELKELRDKFKEQTSRTDVSFLLGYNPPHFAGAGDLIKAIEQAYRGADMYNDFDLHTILMKLGPEVKTQKILLLGYSQGSFYTNALYQYLVQHGVPAESISVYNIATPAHFVAGDGAYLTSANDTLIMTVRETTALGGAREPLPANTILPPVVEYPLPRYPGHSLKDVYLPKATVRMLTDISAALAALAANREKDSCYTPPPITMGHQLTRLGFTLADPASEGVKNGMVIAFTGTRFLMDVAEESVGKVGVALRSLFPPANTATVLTAFDGVRSVYGSSLSRADVEELLGTPPPASPPIQPQTQPSSPPAPEPKPQGQVLGIAIEAPAVLSPPTPPPPISQPSFAPVSANGPIVGGGGAPPPPQAPPPEPPLPAEIPLPPSPPPSQLSITAPAENETFATTTVVLSGTAPSGAQVFITEGATTTVHADTEGTWTAVVNAAEGLVRVSVSAFEEAFSATSTVERSFSIVLPCVVPEATTIPQSGDLIWSAENGPFVIEESQYQRAGVLTIGPGTVVKFAPGATLEIHADVALTVQGTAQAPVLFTSLKDDTGGDTNCDGTLTTPAPGDWGYAYLGGGGWNRALSLSYLKAHYGGAVEVQTTSNGVVFPILLIAYQWFNGSPGVAYTLSTIEVAQSAGIGLHLRIGIMNSLTLSNSSFTDNTSGALFREAVGLYAGALNAENNWWGSATGPFHDTLNPSGLGGTVSPVPHPSETMTLAPWLTEAPW